MLRGRCVCFYFSEKPQRSGETIKGGSAMTKGDETKRTMQAAKALFRRTLLKGAVGGVGAAAALGAAGQVRFPAISS